MNDCVIYRARGIVTMAGDRPDALAVLAGRVVATGTVAELERRFAGCEQVDFGDGVIVPGFNDAHLHVGMTAEDMLHLDLSPEALRSLAEIKRTIAAEARRSPAGAWIRGTRYDDSKMAEGRVLTRFDLDEVAPDHPVLVIHIACHWGVVNSAALRLGGIDEQSGPPDGGEYGRDASGRLNGILYEQALFDFAYPQSSRTGRTVVPRSGLEDRLTGLRRAIERFHAAGLTSIGDALVGPDDLRLLLEADRRGLLTPRVNMLLAAEHYDTLGGVQASERLGNDRLRIGGVKTFVDGAVGGRTCLLEQPFEGSSDDYGIQTRTTDELRDVVRKAHEDGIRVCTHANGDRAIGIILDVYEEAQRSSPRPDLRHRIEHCTVVTEDILRRMKRLGAVAVPFGSYVNYHGSKLLDWYGEKRLERMFAHRWFLDAGVLVAGSSDYPCAPFRPLLAMQSCVTRQGWDGPLLGEGQRIAPLEALGLYTVNAARATGEDGYKGRLVPGQLADFVVLGDDPLTVDPSALASIPVRETYVGGERVWADAG
jgi:predicted amidohydrolase YtcJ